MLNSLNPMTDADIELCIDANYFYIPRAVDYSYSLEVFKDLPLQIASRIADLKRSGWTFYAVDQKGGYCCYKPKIIVVPVKTCKKGGTIKNWIIAHECAHAYAGPAAKHGAEFMKWLKIICPKDAIHHELAYKPKNAKAAGIYHPGSFDF